MSNSHSNGENDKSLNESLDKLGRAYNSLPHDEPPELLDQAILNSARRAVEKKPHWMKFGWLHGLTTAAVFVLALSIILNQREQPPLYESSIRDNELTGLQREKVAKKQSPAVQSDDVRMELKEKSEIRQDVLRDAPVPSAQESEVSQTASEDRAAEPAAEAPRAIHVQDGLQAKTDNADKDVRSNEAVIDEVQVDEADLIVETPDPALLSRQSRPAAVAEYASGEVGAGAETDSDKEKILQDIIRLKQSGDKAWITRLETFKQNYPGYPLPEELSD